MVVYARGFSIGAKDLGLPAEIEASEAWDIAVVKIERCLWVVGLAWVRVLY